MKGMFRFVIVLVLTWMSCVSFIASVARAVAGHFSEAIYLILLAGALFIIGGIAVPASFKKEMR